MKEHTVLVCGGRDYTDVTRIDKVLRFIDRHWPIGTIVTGGADGADYLAELWAERAAIQCNVFRADWEKYGKAAGPIRNQQMLDEGRPDMVVAFPGGRGTNDMVKRARAAGIKLHLVGEVSDEG